MSTEPTRPTRGGGIFSPWLMVCLSLMATAALRASDTNPLADDIRDWDRERTFWSFRAPQPQVLPAVSYRRWSQRRLDHFILARLERHQLAPAREADKRTLIRRLSFDLTGLPPTPEEVTAFLKDFRADAYERLVARLLASPRFGERMASLWLPLARYAEDQAHQVGNDTQYFYPNAWRYREWVVNAFNSDLPYDQFLQLQLAADKIEGTNSPNLAALGFLGLGPKYYNRGRLDVMADEWEDRVDTVSRTMLGLTVACARCHDHKFDPITTRDYYAMAGVFASTRMVNWRPDGTEEKGDAQSTNILAGTLHVVRDADKPEDLPVFIRGNVERKGPVAERGFLRVLSATEPVAFKNGSGRAELAACIASAENPLAARVMVNRVWGHFFGQPLVPTPSNFGHSGQPPTYPELLDDLAVRFAEDGWSIKELVREIVCSATYRLGTLYWDARGAAAASVDPENEFLSRRSRRRLSIEQWRDAALYVTGELDFRGGPSQELDSPTNRLRTLYARVSRLKLNDLLMQYDYPDANVHAEKRSVTTTAMQKLFVLNSPWMAERAQALARRLRVEDPERDTTVLIQSAYLRLFSREPSSEETSLARSFLAQPAKGSVSRWEQYCQLLLASNEMLYVD